MCKKLWVAALAVGVGLLIVGTPVLGYLTVAWEKARCGLEQSVPPEVELQRLQSEHKKLGPEIKNYKRAIIEEQVALERMQKDVRDQEARMDKQKADILTLKHDLENNSTFVYVDANTGASRSYTKAQVEADLQRKFDGYKIAERALESKKATLAAKEKSLEAAQAQLGAMQAEEERLGLQIQELDAKIKELNAAKAASDMAIDNSRSSKIKADLDKLNQRLDVEKRVLQEEAKDKPSGSIDPSKKGNPDLLKSIDDHFSNGKDSVKKESGNVKE